MPVDVNQQLAALGKLWNETIVHVDVSEIAVDDTSSGFRSVAGGEPLASGPTSGQPLDIDNPNTDQVTEINMLTETAPATRRRWLPFALAAAAVVILVVAGLALLSR